MRQARYGRHRFGLTPDLRRGWVGHGVGIKKWRSHAGPEEGARHRRRVSSQGIIITASSRGRLARIIAQYGGASRDASGNWSRYATWVNWRLGGRDGVQDRFAAIMKCRTVPSLFTGQLTAW